MRQVLIRLQIKSFDLALSSSPGVAVYHRKNESETFEMELPMSANVLEDPGLGTNFLMEEFSKVLRLELHRPGVLKKILTPYSKGEKL